MPLADTRCAPTSRLPGMPRVRITPGGGLRATVRDVSGRTRSAGGCCHRRARCALSQSSLFRKSAMASPPSASIFATATALRPGACPVRLRPQPAQRVAERRGQPGGIGQIRQRRDPAWPTTPSPSAEATSLGATQSSAHGKCLPPGMTGSCPRGGSHGGHAPPIDLRSVGLTECPSCRRSPPLRKLEAVRQPGCAPSTGSPSRNRAPSPTPQAALDGNGLEHLRRFCEGIGDFVLHPAGVRPPVPRPLGRSRCACSVGVGHVSRAGWPCRAGSPEPSRTCAP